MRKEAKMKPLRMRVLMVLVMMLMVLPFATSAHASGFDAAENVAYYLCQYYLSCT
jgi:hypothetical protein